MSSASLDTEAEVGLSLLDPDALCLEFVRVEKQVEARFKRLGKVFFWLCVKLEVDPAGVGYKKGIYPLLQAKGATHAGCAHASNAAKVYARVQAGEISEEEYEGYTYQQCLDIARGDAPRPRRQRQASSPRPAVVQDWEPAAAEDLEELLPGNLEKLMEALSAAQDQLLRARDCLCATFPKSWDQLIANALGPIGRLRFEAGERKLSKTDF